MEAIVVALAVAVVALTAILVWTLRSRTTGGDFGGGLDTDRARIDERLNQMNQALVGVSEAIRREGEQRATLSGQLEQMGRQTAELTGTTQSLQRVLSNAQTRGQWGERMAEDIMRRAGLIEGTNFRKQATQAEGAARPDFSFFLPNNLLLNMDVKFPLDNYVRSQEADADVERIGYEREFLRDVRGHIKALATRDYIDPEGGTVDYVLLFIPNEAVYRFVLETGPEVFDEALDHRVVCCSPQMLFAMLALIRQAADTLATQRAAEEIVSLLGLFNQQWRRFNQALDKLGRSVGSMTQAYESLAGTRRKALQRPLDRIEALRTQRGIPIATGEHGVGLPATEESDEGIKN